MIEHVYEKVMNGGSEAGSGAGTPTGDSRGGHGPEGEEGSSMAEGQVDNLFVPWNSLCHLQVELLCNDSVLDPNSGLRTVLLNRNI